MKLQTKATAFHLVNHLASGLYASVGQRVMELVRNALTASMPDPNKWEPKRAKIEISLVPNHPLAAGKGMALCILDHGSGLTDPALERYFTWLGTPISQLREHRNGSYKGSSQNGIGRLAALALNLMCTHEDILVCVKNGFYLLTRTSSSGPVRFVEFIPEKTELDDGFEIGRFIQPNATEMGPLKNIPGSFTAIVIPTPIFKSHTEIFDAIKWFLPRERDKMFQLLIGGKVVEPPPLESTINETSVDGNYRARLGVGNTESDGIWLCDSETGFRVASCQKLGRLLPDPLWFPDISGDIFAPNLLRYQNMERSSLSKEFTRKSNREWQKLMMFLISLAPAATSLIERDAIRGNAAETLDNLVSMFNNRFGEPDVVFSGPEPPVVTKSGGSGTRKPNSGGGSGGSARPDRERYRRYVSINVRKETYHLYRGQSLHPYIFAQVSSTNPNMVLVNVRGGYKSMPETEARRLEHCLMQVLNAIGLSKFAGRSNEASQFANEVRSELLKKS